MVGGRVDFLFDMLRSEKDRRWGQGEGSQEEKRKSGKPLLKMY